MVQGNRESWRGASRELLASAEEDVLVFESLSLQVDEAICQLICLVHIRRVAHRHVLFSIFLLEVAQIGRARRPLLLLMNIGVVAKSRHQQKVALTKLKRERDRKVKRAVPQVVVIVLVLIDGLHEWHRIADATCNLVKHQAWALVQDE